MIQVELLNWLDKYESLLRKGENSAGSNYTIYYSFLNLDSNSIFCEYDDNSSLYLWTYPESSIEINNNPLMCDIQRRWIDSKIRNSVLITKAFDTKQIEILRDVQHQILDLTKNMP